VLYGVTTISRLLKLSVSFAKEPHKKDYILQNRLIISSSLVIEATPYPFVASICVVHVSIDSDVCHSYVFCIWREFSKSLVSMRKKASFICLTYIRSFHMFRLYVSLTVMRVMNMCYTYGGSLLEFLNSLMTKKVPFMCDIYMYLPYVSFICVIDIDVCHARVYFILAGESGVQG